MNKILKLWILILFLCLFSPNQKGFAQNIKQEINIDTTYFLLGTLSEYMGRFYYIDKDIQIDKYYSYEKPLMIFLDSLMKRHFKMKVTTNNLNTYSKNVAIILNSCYDKNGLLIDSLFKTPVEINSYLTGKYYRYGEKISDSVFKIQMTNSPNHKICGILLKRSGCTHINFTHLQNIPAQFIYSFKPTMLLKLYFDEIATQKKVLADSYDELVKSIVGKDEFKKMKSLNK